MNPLLPHDDHATSVAPDGYLGRRQPAWLAPFGETHASRSSSLRIANLTDPMWQGATDAARVFVVDPVHRVREEFVARAAAAGFAAVGLASVAELELWRETPGCVALMVRRSGKEALERLKLVPERCDDRPLIVVVPHDASTDFVVQVMQLGAFSVHDVAAENDGLKRSLERALVVDSLQRLRARTPLSLFPGQPRPYQG